MKWVIVYNNEKSYLGGREIAFDVIATGARVRPDAAGDGTGLGDWNDAVTNWVLSKLAVDQSQDQGGNSDK